MESPDFDAIARRSVERIVHSNGVTRIDRETVDVIRVEFVEQLRLMWNARGAADRDAIDAPFMGLGPFREKVRDAIGKVDR